MLKLLLTCKCFHWTSPSENIIMHLRYILIILKSRIIVQKYLLGTISFYNKNYVSVIKLIFIFLLNISIAKHYHYCRVWCKSIYLVYKVESCVFHYIINQFSICQMLLSLLNDTTKLCHKISRKVYNPTTNARKKQRGYIILWLQKRIRLHLN